MSNVKGSHVKRDTRVKQRKYYKIIEDESMGSGRSMRPVANQKDLQQISKSLLRDRRFLYIDINDQKGFKLMQECEQSDTDEQAEQLGNNFVSRLDNLSGINSKAVSYLFQRKKQDKKKREALEMMSDQLKRSRDKFKKYSFHPLEVISGDGSEMKERNHVYRGMDSEAIERIKLKDEYQQISRVLRAREDSLLQYYSTIDTHRPHVKLLKRSSRRLNQQRSNSVLPEIAAIHRLHI